MIAAVVNMDISPNVYVAPQIEFYTTNFGYSTVDLCQYSRKIHFRLKYESL